MLSIQETSPARHLVYGWTTVTTVATPLTVIARECAHGILLRCPGVGDSNANSGVVFVGDAKVTVTSGMPILPGGSLELPLDSAADIYVVTDNVSSQIVQWMGV